MGSKWQVSIWIKDEWCQDGNYYWKTLYSGESMMKAFYEYLKAMKMNTGCIKLEHRK